MNRLTGTGNRAFWTLVGLSLALRAVYVFGACCLASAIYRQVRGEGMRALWSGDPVLLPGILVLALTAAGTLRAAWSLGHSVRDTHSFVRTARNRRSPVPPRLRTAADELGIGSRVRCAESAHPFALTYGISRPRVLVSTGLLDALTDAELSAVLAHERAHVRSRDPLKNVLARAIPARHFYLPGLTRLQRSFIAGRELAADRAALAGHSTAALAGSLLKVVDGPAWARSVPAAAMAAPELLDARITQLETGTPPPPAPAGHLATVRTGLAVLGFGAAAVWSSMIVMQTMPLCMALT